MSKHYLVNEIFYTIHGEGVRYGIPHVFVRFAQCNLACGFCDTEFESYQKMTAQQIYDQADSLWDVTHNVHEVAGGAKHNESTAEHDPVRNVLFCGGEPLLQLDSELIEYFSMNEWFSAVETNGTIAAPDGLDWITCSPKVAEHAMVIKYANELKYVKADGQSIPRPAIKADHYLISPMFEGDQVDNETMQWCIQLVKDNPLWRLTVQHHKVNFGGIR